MKRETDPFVVLIICVFVLAALIITSAISYARGQAEERKQWTSRITKVHEVIGPPGPPGDNVIEGPDDERMYTSCDGTTRVYVGEDYQQVVPNHPECL